MDEILEKYKQGKFKKCVELIKLLPASENLVDNFIIENCSLVCKSVVSILEDNSEEKNKIEKKFHFLFENVTSVGIIDTSISLQLKLIVTYNLYWWLLFHSKKEFDEDQKEEYLQMIDAGLSRVLGCSQTNTYLSTTEKIIENLNGLKKLSTSENSENVLLIVEIVVVVLMYIGNLGKKYLKKCANVATMFLVDLKETILSNESFDKFFKRNYPSHLFKFGLNKTATTLSEIHSSAVDYLQTLESVFLLLLGNFRDSLESVHKNLESSFSGLQTYIAALNCFKLNKINLCMGFINKTSLSNVQLNLKMRFLILKGQLCSANGNHKEAAKHFENTINICFSCPLPYYYAGHQWGKIGLNDLMVECFEKLLQVVQNQNHKAEIFKQNNFESMIIGWIHPDNEIAEDEALYALATSYGLSERFIEAAETYKNLLEYSNCGKPKGDAERVLQIPNWLTVFHDASIANLLAGNLVEAEKIALKAVNQYLPEEYPSNFKESSSLLDKDVNWLQKTIEEELLEIDIVSKKVKNDITYSENLIYFLPENVIALLILSEVQRIQDAEEYTTTLKQLFSCFSNYLAKVIKKEDLNEREKQILCIVKALASKTCLRIANVQIQHGNTTNTEKMFKRSLSCNKGDKDVLHDYCKFLIGSGKKREASKLWCTFCSEAPAIALDSVQSLSLRYFLSSKVTNGDLEKLQKELQIN